jgi:hypothetical protein
MGSYPCGVIAVNVRRAPVRLRGIDAGASSVGRGEEMGGNGEEMGRVAAGVASRRSRRSGLAQLRHPARLATDSPALCYLPALRRQASGALCPQPVARRQFRDEASPSLPRVPAQRFPWLPGTTRRSDSLAPFRRASLCFAWRYHDVRLYFAPTGPARITGRPGLGNPAPPPEWRRGEDRASQVPRQPLCTYALLYDPGGTGHASP